MSTICRYIFTSRSRPISARTALASMAVGAIAGELVMASFVVVVALAEPGSVTDHASAGPGPDAGFANSLPTSAARPAARRNVRAGPEPERPERGPPEPRGRRSPAPAG